MAFVNWVLSIDQATRNRVYQVLVAVGALLLVTGKFVEAEVGAWLNVAAAVLGISGSAAAAAGSSSSVEVTRLGE